VAFDDIETPFGRAEKAIGGAATYISLAASYFAEKVRIVSVVGDDFPEGVLQDLKSRNIDLEGLEIKKGEKSFFWAGRYHNDMNSRDTLDTIKCFSRFQSTTSRHLQKFRIFNVR